MQVPGLAEGWVCILDRGKGVPYYFHKVLHVSTWTMPRAVSASIAGPSARTANVSAAPPSSAALEPYINLDAHAMLDTAIVRTMGALHAAPREVLAGIVARGGESACDVSVRSESAVDGWRGTLA